MSLLLIAALALVAPADEGATPSTPPSPLSTEVVGTGVPSTESVEHPPAAPRTGNELRHKVRSALSRWARPEDKQADTAACEFLALFVELQRDDQLAFSQREYFKTKVRGRLLQLSEQITKRIARKKRLAESQRPETVQMPEGKSDALAQRPVGGNFAAGFRQSGFGQGGAGTGDYGQHLVDLIQRTIRPQTWDVNGGPGTIYYWYPGRALVVRQMDEVHHEIGGLLQQIRRLDQ